MLNVLFTINLIGHCLLRNNVFGMHNYTEMKCSCPFTTTKNENHEQRIRANKQHCQST